MVMAGLIVFGVIGFKGMGISQLPDVEFPNISVSLSWPGAAPEVMESDVVDVVEQTIMTVEGVREIVGPGAAMTGFYSYGEVSPFTPNARCELHNQTMTVTTLSER